MRQASHPFLHPKIPPSLPDHLQFGRLALDPNKDICPYLMGQNFELKHAQEQTTKEVNLGKQHLVGGERQKIYP